MNSLEEFHYPPEHLRDWAATGCVEPTLSGKHIGHTNCMMFNMVAALEMAMFNGRHPLMRWDVGPRTGDIDSGAFTTFDEFFDAFCAQLDFLMDMLEEEDSEDQDYWIDSMTLQYFQENGGDPALIKLLQDAIGESEGVEIEWVSDEEEQEE